MYVWREREENKSPCIMWVNVEPESVNFFGYSIYTPSGRAALDSRAFLTSRSPVAALPPRKSLLSPYV